MNKHNFIKHTEKCEKCQDIEEHQLSGENETLVFKAQFEHYESTEIDKADAQFDAMKDEHIPEVFEESDERVTKEYEEVHNDK